MYQFLGVGSAGQRKCAGHFARDCGRRSRAGLLRSQKKTNDSAMDIRALTSFVAVAGNLSFALAAERLNTVLDFPGSKIEAQDIELLHRIAAVSVVVLAVHDLRPLRMPFQLHVAIKGLNNRLIYLAIESRSA
jgi:hypothetical protein